MRNLVFISGLSHSGTTLLDLILGCNPKLVGLGEVARVIDRELISEDQFQNINCSCGEPMLDCPVWSKAIRNLESLNEKSFASRYQSILDTVGDLLGSDVTIVDSSKYLNYLKPIVGSKNISAKIIHIVKDVRNYTVSQVDNIRRNPINRKAFFKNNAYYIFWQWYLMNRSTQKYLVSGNIKYLQIGYEELCLSTEKVLDLIGEFTNLQMDTSLVDLSDSFSHSVLGNRMRTQKEKSKIAYDYRWFQRKEWQMPAFLFANIMEYNRKNVYGNDLLKVWSR
jgi:hypothetical protein